MRKLAAILLICLLVFNWYGYRVLIELLQKKANNELQVRLDRRQYKDDELIELHIPLNLPYVADWKDFESYDGETAINGLHFRYVKRKLSNGELILLCIPNENKNKLEKAGGEIFRQVSDLQQNPGKKQSDKNSLSKSFSPDYTCINANWQSKSFTSDLQFTSFYVIQLLFQSKNPPAQPPDC